MNEGAAISSATCPVLSCMQHLTGCSLALAVSINTGDWTCPRGDVLNLTHMIAVLVQHMCPTTRPTGPHRAVLPGQDIAIVTGAEYVAKDLGMKVATTGVEALGTARKARNVPGHGMDRVLLL